MTKIYVPSGTTNLRATGVTLTDTRADKDYCGLVGDDLRTTELEERTTSLENRTTNLEGRVSDSETEINKIKNGTTSIGEAEKAKKLTTARTINGTSFDGTENITTNQWGQGRNITIDGVLRFVDGGSNVDFNTINIYEETIVANGTYTDGGITKKGEKKLLILKNGGDFYIQKQSIRQLVVYSSGSGFVHDVSATVLEIGNDTQKISTVRSYPCFVFIIGV